MNFTSLIFLLFYPVLLRLYRKYPSCRTGILLIGSYFFYMSQSPVAGLLLLGVTLVTWSCGGLLAAAKQKGLKTAEGIWTALGVSLPLILLFWFKYTDFFLESIGSAKRFSPVLPVGISFFTFQALSYVLDIKSGRIQPEENLLFYSLFVSFFPQLVAGPIERPEHLLPQLKEAKNRCGFENDREYINRMLHGFFKKLVGADFFAVLADPIFADPVSFGAPGVILGGLLFTLQIYCDFSGYCDIAVGAAGLLGVELIENFDHPYRAVSIRDFWRRWHISLTQWLTDYLYIPLGGNRNGRLRTMFNILIVFTLSGLWHGAGWNFVLWGLFHGVCMVVGRGCHLKDNHVRTMLLVVFGWIIFRADGVGQLVVLLKQLAVGWTLEGTANLYAMLQNGPWTILHLAAVLTGLYLLDEEKIKGWILVPLIVAGWIYLLAGGQNNAFIYFRF